MDMVEVSDFASTGSIGWISYALIPTIRLAPAPVRVKQWKYQYDIGASTAPYIATISCLSFSYLMTQRKPPQPFHLLPSELGGSHGPSQDHN